jgi:hypothetical protein
MMLIGRPHFGISTRFIGRVAGVLSMATDGQPDESGVPLPAHLPAQAGRLDPLVMQDGRKVTKREMWLTERRPELVRLFQHYIYGGLPPKRQAVFGKVERGDANLFDGEGDGPKWVPVGA